MTENLVVCSKCGAINRFPSSRYAIDAKCGKCKVSSVVCPDTSSLMLPLTVGPPPPARLGRALAVQPRWPPRTNLWFNVTNQSRKAGFSSRVVWIVVATAIAVFIGGQAEAQSSRELDIDDQPGGVPGASEERLPTAFQRQAVYYRTSEPAGTIFVDTADRYLYLIQGNNRAMRYGIGVGRDGFQWQGLLRVSRKAEWPDWTPPPEMINRRPYLPRFMAGGPGNPMGARALYLGATIYRIHGTNQPQTIGSAISSGCFRLVNDDVVDLYNRVPVGTKVVVRQRPTL